MYWQKFLGKKHALPPKMPLNTLIFIWFGGFLAISTLGFLAYFTKQPFVLGSFGASCFVVFILPESPVAQPRNVIGGHFICSLVGLFFYHFIGIEWWSMAMALSTSLVVMQVLRVGHPPAGSNPIIVFLSGAGWSFLWLPTLVGAIILVGVALLFNNLAKDRHYPTYW